MAVSDDVRDPFIVQDRRFRSDHRQGAGEFLKL
jgi:hypothetical protein